MANLWTSLRSRQESRYTLDEYAKDISDLIYHSGFAYQGLQQTLVGDGERIEGNFPGIITGAYKANGVVFACQVARMLVFTEARLSFRRRIKGRPGDLFGTPELEIVERPWPNGSTGELLAKMLQDADFAGNAYIRRTLADQDQRLERLRPDWVLIILGSNSGLMNPDVLGYLYQEGGFNSSTDPVVLDVDEVAHWSPIPDPLAAYRGMSWLSPVLREINADSAATLHKLKFFEQGATPNMVVSLHPDIPFEDAKSYLDHFKGQMDASHAGVRNAYKTLFLAGGADATVVGSSFEQMSFKQTQGAGETRIAAAARVPPIIVGLSEGLQSATYSNYGQARRHFADSWARPMWRSSAEALSTVVNVPVGAELWYDDRDISFLQEDRKDAADIQQVQATTIAGLVRDGFTPESVVSAVLNEDFSLLEHTGKLSVQLKNTDESASEPPNSQEE